MASTANKVLSRRSGDFDDLKVKGTTKVFEGSAVSRASGLARPLVKTDANFAGWCEVYVDNSGGSDGDKRVQVRRGTQYRELAVVGATGVGDIGKSVYASDDETFTLTASANMFVGLVVDHVSGTKCVVKLMPNVRLMPAIADLGQDISATYVEAEIQAISDKVDAILAALRTAGFLLTG